MYFTSLQQLIDRDLQDSRIHNLTGSSAALFFALYEKPFLAVELTEEHAEELSKDINFFREALKKNRVLFLMEPNGPSISGKRAKVVYSLDEKNSLVSSFKNLKSIVWSKQELREHIIKLEKGMNISRAEIEKRFHDIGYKTVPIVTEKGEFRRCGWIVDVFPSTSDIPLRLEFFGDEIENMRTFDVDTQRSTEDISQFLIFPAEDPGSGQTPFDLLDRKIFLSDSVQEKENLPENVTFFSRFSFGGPGYDAGVLSMKGLGITHEERKNIEDLPVKIKHIQKKHRTVIVSSSQGQAERLLHIFRDGGVVAPIIDKADIFNYEGTVSITIGELSSGLFLPGIIILTGREIFGDRPIYRPIRKSKVSNLLTTLDDLRPGDFVVHRDHGIGKFSGLVRQKTEGIEEDLMLIEYENGRLYLPLQGIHSIHKYYAKEGIIPATDRLGGKTWQRTKEKVKKKIQEMAEKLISLYAEREVYNGFSFSPDTELHREFDSFFPYEETPDQIRAVEDIKKDMESEKPMDRLICGDVGYGKTEVVMRAAFKAVYDGMQVAVLVPTTILCEQHYRTFKARFSAFPVTLDYLSRFKSAKRRKETIKALSNGDIDIIIGTHSLLGRQIRFHKLGLIIIDEEHRFGVRQKEKLKELKKGIDVIILSATPIPRTLYMALSTIREMSIIETPPEDRLAVKSTVSTFNEELIREAIERELERNGQVFFVHNRIKDIYRTADYLRRLTPSAKLAVAHGQMAEKELENIMLQFYECTINFLVSTAIIGSGIDIPTANTIIINMSHAMGLADLYQLRGRVGRGNVRAYAYFLIPGEDIITEEAKKRLQAIQEMSYLGAGFRLALKDLEIRGAGNLLGAEQSGHIHAVGFDLYTEMLEKAIADLKGVKIEEEFEPIINLKVNAFIAEYYVDDVMLRLSLYRKIAASKTEESLRSLESEIEDRFGKLPDEAKNLLEIMRLKIIARKLLITTIHDIHGKVKVLFSHETGIEPKDIFALNIKRKFRVRFLHDGFELDLRGLSWKEVYQELSEIMSRLLKSTSLLV